MKKIIIFVILALLLVNFAMAKEARVKLLAVTETPEGFKGATADLAVEIREGSGRVYMDTFPLSRLDTQISTRFAKEIACEFSEVDCSKYDFFYTIRATSPIIAGPSAGAAISGITLATLENQNVNSKVSVTGTINSGGIVGPVSGVKEKLQAARDAGLDKVLIPVGEAELLEKNNSINLTEFGKSIGLEVIVVKDVGQVYFHLTGRQLKAMPTEFKVDPKYTKTMKTLADDLCARTQTLASQINFVPNNSTDLIIAQNLSRRGNASMALSQYYSAASFCFGANVRYHYIIMSSLENDEIGSLIRELESDIDTKKNSIPKYETITDLETYALVLERIEESEQSLNDSLTLFSKNSTQPAIRELAFSIERLKSANYWGKFFGIGGKKVNIDRNSLLNSCVNKLAEAEERYQYVILFIPDALQKTRSDLNTAYIDLKNEKFDVCLFKASRAKAEADALLSVFGVSEESFPEVLKQKAEAVKSVIAKQTQRGNFPIAGYSYFEYANSLRDYDQPSALLFYEYALELSNLNMYFNGNVNSGILEEDGVEKVLEVVKIAFLISLGMLLGLLLAFSIRPRKKGILRKHKKHYN